MEILSKDGGMSAATEARSHLELLIGDDRLPLKSALPKIAGIVGMTHRRIRALWSGEARRIEHDEIMLLRTAAIRKQTKDAANYASRLENLAKALETSDAEFHSADIEMARVQAHRLRALVGGAQR